MRHFKNKLFLDKWAFTAKADAQSIPIIDKIHKKISLQKNWRNSGINEKHQILFEKYYNA